VRTLPGDRRNLARAAPGYDKHGRSYSAHEDRRMYVVVFSGIVIFMSLYVIAREDIQEALRKRKEPILRRFLAAKKRREKK